MFANACNELEGSILATLC